MDFILGFLELLCMVFVLPGSAFLSLPVVIALTKKVFKRKTLKIFTVVNALCGLAVYSSLFMFPYPSFEGAIFCLITAWIWSFPAYAILKKGSGIDSKCMEYDPNRVVECTSCGYRSKKFFTACPKCNNYTKQYVCLNQENAAVKE